MQFSLFSEMADLNAKQWLLFGFLTAIGVSCFVFLYRKNANSSLKGTKTAKPFDTRAMVYGAMCIALAFVLSYLRLFRLPQGGSITPGSMLPIMIYAYWYGPRRGFTAALAYSFLQFIQDPYFLNFAQFALDYTLGFSALGLAAFFPKNLPLGALVSGAARFVCSLISGMVFFGSYAADAGMSPFAYSFSYQLATIAPDTVICVVLAAVLTISGVLQNLRPSNARPVMNKVKEAIS